MYSNLTREWTRFKVEEGAAAWVNSMSRKIIRQIYQLLSETSNHSHELLQRECFYYTKNTYFLTSSIRNSEASIHEMRCYRESQNKRISRWPMGAGEASGGTEWSSLPFVLYLRHPADHRLPGGKCGMAWERWPDGSPCVKETNCSLFKQINLIVLFQICVQDLRSHPLLIKLPSAHTTTPLIDIYK